MTSSRNGVLALLIANNFVEVKGSVFKKWDTTRVWSLACQVRGRQRGRERGGRYAAGAL